MSLPQQRVRIMRGFHPKGDHPLDGFCNFFFASVRLGRRKEKLILNSGLDSLFQGNDNAGMSDMGQLDKSIFHCLVCFSYVCDISNLIVQKFFEEKNSFLRRTVLRKFLHWD